LGAGAAADDHQPLERYAETARLQDLARAVRDAHPQATPRHCRSHASDRGLADEARPARRRRRRDQALMRVQLASPRFVLGRRRSSRTTAYAPVGSSLGPRDARHLDSRPLADSYLGRVARPAAGPSIRGFAARFARWWGRWAARRPSLSVVADPHVQPRTLRSAPPSGLAMLAIWTRGPSPTRIWAVLIVLRPGLRAAALPPPPPVVEKVGAVEAPSE